MNWLSRQSEWADLHEQVERGRRITDDQALRLFASSDLNGMATLANTVRERKAGNRASYIVNRYVNYSNYCILSCQFCAFARKKRDQDGFELSVDEIVGKAREALALGITELHIVGGLHPSLPFDYYTGMLSSLKAVDSRLHLKCFTAVEALHLAWLAKKPLRDTLSALRDAGLDSLTGGGAEIFSPPVRSRIAKGKESAEQWLDVHRTWHGLGGRSTCTMLFGHLESHADRVDHLRRLRELQDETGGFTGFIPLPYQPENNAVPVRTAPTGHEALKTIAVSRLYLDNIDHVTAYWVGLGMKLAQISLSFGADDLHGTIVEEHIFKMAGAADRQMQTRARMIQTIREAGCIPYQRDSLYRPLPTPSDPTGPHPAGDPPDKQDPATR